MFLTQLLQLKVRKCVTGVLSYVPKFNQFSFWLRKKFAIGPESRPGDYGLGVLQERLADLEKLNFDLTGKNFLEIAPGENFSGPIAAIALGASTATGIDAFDYTDMSKNNLICSEICQKLGKPSDEINEICLELYKMDKVKSGSRFSYFAPWKTSDISKSSLDLVTSISTLEHVEDPALLYGSVNVWLRKGGIMVNKIDFSSHGMTKDWFGHLVINDGLWRLVGGRRFWHLNRWTEEQHIAAGQNAKLKLVKKEQIFSSNAAPAPFSKHPIVSIHIWMKE